MNIKCPVCNSNISINTIANDDIELSILNDGYIPNNNIWRRWVMAQMLRHYKDIKTGKFNFDKYFVQNKPYFYSWSVALNEMRAIARITDDDERDKRRRFFNRSVIYEMFTDYRTEIEKYIKKRFDNGSYRYIQDNNGDMVKTICLPYYNKTIALDGDFDGAQSIITLEKLLVDIDRDIRIMRTSGARMPRTDKHFADYLKNFMSKYPMHVKLKKSNAWKNAFKGAGAYYTMDNMIKFHGCVFTVDGVKTNMLASLNLLEEKTDMYRGEYYKLFAVMKQFIEDNNYSIDSLDAELSSEE